MVKVIPDMLRLGNHRSVYGMVAKYMEDERLRQVFTFQPLLIGGNPFRTTSIYTLIHWLERKWGVHFAKGGTTAFEPELECAPAGGHDHAAVLTVARALRSSNWAGLRYPRAECNRR